MKIDYCMFQRITRQTGYKKELSTDNAAPCRHCGSTCAHYAVQPTTWTETQVVQVFCVSCHVTDSFAMRKDWRPSAPSAADVSKAHRDHFKALAEVNA